MKQLVAVVGAGSGKPEGVLSVLPAHARAVLEPFQGDLVDCLHRTRRYPRGPFAVRVPQEVEYDFSIHCVDPLPVGAVLHGEGGGHPFPVRYCTRDGHCPGAGEVGREGNAGRLSARLTLERIGGHVARGLWDPVVPSGAEPPCVEGSGVPAHVGVAGSQLFDTQGQLVVWRGCPGDSARLEPERHQVAPEPRWAPALMHHQGPCVLRLVL